MMKTLRYLTLIFLMGGLWTACKKGDPAPAGLTALNVINASTDVPSVAVNFTIPPTPFYKQQAVVGYGSVAEYGNLPGSLPLTLVSSADTTQNLFQGTLNIGKGKIFSLYICGTLPRVDTLLMQDNIPVHRDSTSGLRIINLSPDSGPLSVNIAGASATDFTPLAYKQISAFKSYPVTSAIINNGGYNFEVKDGSGNVVATFSWNNSFFPFKNYTMVISGLASQSSVQVFQVNNF